MGRVSTDDAARRQEFVWLGTPDVPTPFEARGSAWGMGIALSLVFSIVAYLATPFLALMPGPFIVTFVARGVVAVVIGIAAAVPVVRWVGKHIDPKRKARYHWRVLLDEISGRRPDDTHTTTYVAGNVLPLGKRPEHVTTTLVPVMSGTHDAHITLDEIHPDERATPAPTKD
jgi:hypothetical protein